MKPSMGDDLDTPMLSPAPYEGHPTLAYSSGKALMTHGPDALHDHMSTKMQAGLGRALPQMEVRFQNLSITADVVVSTDANNTNENILPTLPNVILQSFSGLSATKTKVTKHILKNVNGVFKPGTMTLVLGQAGSGKSSLMKILSGRFPLSKATKLEGEILYNGATSSEVRKRLPQFVSYVTQRDCHFPTLTVKETFEFAHECCGGELSKHAEDQYKNGTPEENREALEAAQAWVRHYPEIVTHQLGLEICEDTIVGDAMTRGVSGGERKRVTTGEMQFGNKVVSFMDEISTGLDSAATYDIVKTQLSLARKLRKTVVISLLQPAPEVFELFDYVLILNEGHVIYHGPQESALGYFEGLGFVRPEDRDVADFLLDIGTRQQHNYQKGLPAGAKYPRKASELADAFERSTIHEVMLAVLHSPHDPQLIKDREDFFDSVPEFRQSFWESTATLLRHQSKVTWRNVPFVGSRVVMVIMMGLINGSVFWQTDAKQVQIVMGLLFQAVLFMAFGQFAQIPTFFAARDVFYKQRGANFYRTSSYVMAFTANQFPIAVAETLTFGSMIYWMCGLASSVQSFVMFEVLSLVTSMAFTSMFFFFSTATPNLTIANPVSLIVLTFITLYGGFALSESQMPDALVWIYWINPLTYVIRGLAVNQYSTAEFDVPIYNGIDYFGMYGKNMGKYSLELVGLQTEKYWLWLGIVFIGATYVVFITMSWFMLEYYRFEQPENSDLAKTDGADKAHSATGSFHSSSGSEYALTHTPRGDFNADVMLELKPSTERKITPVTLAFKDLWYTVPNPQNPKEGLDLLKGISGYATPGTITALMGSSGAGKTTLMDVIAGRKTGGKIQGQILLNGHPATPLAIQRSTGYCEQTDIHSEASTFREALTFSSFLRQGENVPASEKYDWVDECLDLLDLRPIADKIIRGSSVEQMKRLTIGVELAARPSVLFLDEPTSGLDARSAKLVMDSVRKVANTGVTVVCTIHQPSAEVFQVFDSLLLLKRGGYTVFFGEVGKNARELVSYLQSIDGVPRLEKGYNPATWMLEAIGAGVGNTSGQDTDFVEIFNKSAKKASMENTLDSEGMMHPAAGVSALSFTNKRAASNTTQAKFLMKRFQDLYWRTASYNLTRIGVQFSMGLIFGLSYASLKYETYQGINGGMAMLFMSTLFSSFIAFSSVVPVIIEDRAAFYRERASQTYNAFWYFFAAMIVEIPYVFSSALLFSAVVFPTVGFVGVPEFFFYWLILALFFLAMTYFGMLLAFALPSVEVAMGVGMLVISIWGIFVGFNPPASAIPTGYKWLYQLTPHRYALEAISTVVLGNCDPTHLDRLACKTLVDAPPTLPKDLSISVFLDTFYGMSYDHVWRDVFAILGFGAVFAFFALVSLRFVNHMKR